MIQPVIKGVSEILAHAPSFIRHGSKPGREIVPDAALLQTILAHLRSYREALSYAPHQVFVGRMRPDAKSADHFRYIEWMHYAEGSAMVPLLLHLYAGFLGEGAAPGRL